MIRAIRMFAHRTSLRVADDRGATAVEYGLMLALLAIFIIAAVVGFGRVLDSTFQDPVR